MAQFNKTYPTKQDLLGAIGTKDFVEFDSNELFDSVQRNYIFVPLLNSLYVSTETDVYRLTYIGDIVMYNQ